MSILKSTLAVTRDSAVAIHAALLESTRLGWERRHGRVPDAATLLRLATEVPEFAWLAPLTTLIAALDEALHHARPEAIESAILTARALIDLLRADEEGSPFQARYFREVHDSPDVAVVVARARSGLQASLPVWT